MDLRSRETVATEAARRERDRFSPASASLETKVYNAVLDSYGEDRFVLECDPYLLSELLVEGGFLLEKPPVDVVIHIQDLLRTVER